jgi:NET1-associated nuclear protein 1 (U3 small nucleolar RNA-associated protein 17)
MLEPSRVEQAVVSSSGEWLATIDSREGDEFFRGEVYLKVWRWESSVRLWALNTRIDRPHGLAEVTSIAFSPNDTFGGTFLVTSGKDGYVKSWRIRSVTDKKTGISDGASCRLTIFISLTAFAVFWVARSSLTFKREIPWSITWSPDGSLLAVAFGAYVAIYDSSSNALIRAFTASELRGRIRSVSFLGEDGRFLAVAGLSDVVLWDLVKQKGKPFSHFPFVVCSPRLTCILVQWHHRDAHRINAVITHPRHERFAVFYSQPPNSTVSIFDPSSSSPSDTHTLPFTLRNIVWYPQSPSKAKGTSTFHVVGITDSWDVVLCGDDVQPLAGESSGARALVSGSQEPQKRTLFQDIFGDSALTVRPIVQQNAVGNPKHWNSKEIANVFDGPAYLIPALDTLFDSLMSRFLTLRPSEDEDAPAPDLPGDGEDSSMDIDEPSDGPLVRVPRSERIVDAQEMEALIGLFRQHGVKGERHSFPFT